MFSYALSKLALGFLTSLEIFAFTLVFAIPLGLLVAFGSMSKFAPVKYLFRGIIWVIRGTPLMLQILVVCYGPGLIGLPAMRSPMLAVVIAFVINYACYFSEIYRGGIESVSKGQYEAGQVLGMTKNQVFFKIVLLQVIRRIIAPMSNEIITLVKDTSLANTISVVEIVKAARDMASSFGLELLPLLLGAGAFYLLFVGLLTIIFNKLEKKLSYYKV
ncbi:MAG: amino acid ABC transporter permease [Clostridia bacterium]|nr:amino acid ABC transporter permease [Clostridia bacterium]